MSSDKSNQPTHTDPGLSTLASGLVDFVTGKDRWYGLTEQNSSVGGKTILPLALVNFIMLMAIFTKVSGSTINQMAMESLFTLMELITRERGLMTFSMVKVRRHGLMARLIQANTSWVRSMGEVFTSGMMGADTMASGMKTR